MSRNWSKADPEGNSPVPHQDEFGPEKSRLADVFRLFEERVDRELKVMESCSDQQNEKSDELAEKMIETGQRSASLEQDARQPRLATEADVTSDKKTRKHTESAAVDQAMNGDGCFAKRVQAGPTSSTSFGMRAESSALPRRDDVLVDKGAAAPKPCLSAVEIRTLTAAAGLLPAGKASIKTRIIYCQPRLRFCPTAETNSDSTRRTVFSGRWRSYTQQTLVFDPGGSTGRLHACPFVETWRTLLCGEVTVWALDGTRGWSVFWQVDDRNIIFRERDKRIVYAVRVAVNRCFSAARLV